MAANKPINSTDVAKSIGDAIRRHLEQVEGVRRCVAAVRKWCDDREKEGKNTKQGLPGDTRPLLRTTFPLMAKRAQAPSAPTPLRLRHRPRKRAWSPRPHLDPPIHRYPAVTQAQKQGQKDLSQRCLQAPQTQARAATSIGWIDGVGRSASLPSASSGTQVLTSV